jgi:hypothetical protein
MEAATRPKRANIKEPTSMEDALMNRSRLQDMMEGAVLSDVQAACLLMEESGRPCGVRTLQHWLKGDASKVSNRCPDWAVQALERGLRKR